MESSAEEQARVTAAEFLLSETEARPGDFVEMVWEGFQMSGVVVGADPEVCVEWLKVVRAELSP